ncbi:retrovirus-related pol polyprotein from transposon TNT 1-94 [Tanacetum coccineum]
MNTLLHMIPIKLSSTNYLLWKNQMLPLLSYQKLTNHIDGTTAPSATITSGDQSIPNPAFTTWNDFDQRAVILLNSSLTEEAAAEVLGLTTAHAIWTALETAYSNSSVERIHSLRDSLRNLSKGTSTVSDYGRQFKGICDKLAAIGQPVDEMDKLHWFVCGLGASFETFSTAIRTTKPFTTFRDLLSQAESHEMFLKSLHGSATPPAAFFSQQSGSRSSQGRQQRQQNYSRGGGRASNSNGGRGRGGRRPPHCQLCRTNGHYASSCPSLHTYASNAATSDANLAQAFTSQCHVTQGHPDWYVDSGATAHMTSSPDNVSHSAPHSGNMRVFFGNGDALPVSHIGQSMVSNKILLRDVLVIPKLTKNLLSISKLTMDHPVDVLFSQPFFNIQDRETKQVIAQGLCEDGLYVLRDTPMALAATVGVSRKASFELWHNRLGHVSFDVISTLNKLGVLDVTSILPKPNICKPCQLSKSQRLPFELNSKRSSYPLDLIHCDLWGPAPVSSDGYLYYIIFVDDYSRFTWFYPLKTKSGFHRPIVSKLVQAVPRDVSSNQSGVICAQGYKVKNVNAPILEAIIKKHGDIASTCVFPDAALRTSLLDVVCEIVGRIETNDAANIISQMEEIESQLSAAEAAKINVSWLRASLNAIHKRNEAGKKGTLLLEMKTNTFLVKRAARNDLVAAENQLADAKRCVEVLNLVEKTVNKNFLESKAERDLLAGHPII